MCIKILFKLTKIRTRPCFFGSYSPYFSNTLFDASFPDSPLYGFSPLKRSGISSFCFPFTCFFFYIHDQFHYLRNYLLFPSMQLPALPILLPLSEKTTTETLSLPKLPQKDQMPQQQAKQVLMPDFQFLYVISISVLQLHSLCSKINKLLIYCSKF